MKQRTPFLGSDRFKLGAVALFVAAVAAVFISVSLPGGAKHEVSQQGEPCPTDAKVICVVMWSSGEKMNYLKDIVAEFNKAQHTLPGSGKKIHVQAYTVNSGPQSDYLVGKIRDGIDFPAGITPPQIASPSVDHWLTRVNYLTGVQVFDVENAKALARTPVVIATYEEMARVLGWPQKELGWADIIDLANNPQGWAAYPGAKVEWGKKPLLAWTDPNVSSTGRTALFATYVAASGKPAPQLTIEDVRNPAVQQYVKNLQGAVDHYFPETLKLQTKIFLGPRFIQFVPLEEYNLVWLKQGKVNAESAPGGEVTAKPLDKKMVAIYPKEGTIWHNNPGAILRNVPWTGPEQQAAAALFVDYLLEPPQQEKAIEWGFRPANPNVPNGPYLTAEYGIDPAKPQKLLGNVDPAVAEEIMSSWQDVKKPGIVVLVLDVSGSMEGDKLTQAKEGALKFLDAMAGNNYVGVLTFSGSINKTVEIGPITKNKFDLAAVVESAQAGGNTALYDAVKKAVDMADKYPLSGEATRGVVVLTDGENTAGIVKLSDLITLSNAQEQPISIFAGNAGEKKTDLHGSQLASQPQHSVHVFSVGYGKDADLEVLRIFSEATNSTFNIATVKNITQVLELFGKYF